MSRTFTGREVLVVVIATLLILTFSPGLASANAGGNDSKKTASRTEEAKRFGVYTYKVPDVTMRKAKRFCGNNYTSSTTAYDSCITVQHKRRTQTQVIKTRQYWLARKSSMDASWWYLYIRPILKNDRKQLRSSNTDILALITELCKVKQCGGSPPSTVHLVRGWDWVGGTYVGVLLSRHLTTRWSQELSAIDGAAAGAAYLCGKIPKIGIPGVVATGLCVAIVALKYGGIKSDFQIAKSGGSTKCVELRFHTLYAIGLADASKVVKCQ